MFRFALAFLAGNLWLQCQPVLSLVYLLPLWLTFLSLRAATCFRSWLPYSILTAALVGFVYAFVSAQVRLEQDLVTTFEGHDLRVFGYISDIPVHESYGQRFMFNIEHSEVPLPKTIELTWYDDAPQLSAAQRWQFNVRLKRRHGFANPGGADYESQLFRRGIGATGYISTKGEGRQYGNVRGLWVLKLRQRLVDKITATIPHASMQGVIRGLSVGDQQAISAEAWQVFARTGISHLMAISGFHVGMVAVIGAWLGAGLIYIPIAQRLRLTRQDLKALFGLSAALGYSLLAGMSIPTQRTLIMLAVYYGAGYLRREVNVWNSYGLALLLVLIVDPFAPLSVGMWLSFGAVAAILINQQGRISPASGWRGFLSIQGIVSLGLVPLLVCSFGALSLISPLVNLFAIPLFTAVIVPLVLLACAVLVINEAWGGACLEWISQGLSWVYVFLEKAAHLPWASLYLPSAPLLLVILMMLGTCIAVTPWPWSWRWLGVLFCMPALFWRVDVPDIGDYELTVLDVGQGLAVLIRTYDHVLLYDTGPAFQGGGDAARLTVLPYLRAIGVDKLDMVLLSHGDADHVGGMQSILAEMNVAAVLAGPSVKSAVNMRQCRQGDRWIWEGVEFLILHPEAITQEESDNNLSCVLQVSNAGGKALLLGDVEQAAERGMVERGLISATEIIVAAHHGSRSSSTPELVNATSVIGRRQWVIFSAGYRNRWGFPKAEVLGRWQEAGAIPLETSRAGAVSLLVSPKNTPVEPILWRDSHQRYWHLR